MSVGYVTMRIFPHSDDVFDGVGNDILWER